ncbi:MAG: hypothetical protein Q6373_024270 [Candidatus Sigynarchaeota archaeon]
MYKAPASLSTWSEFAQQLNRILHESLALCEPWFGHGSLIFSPCKLHFKVNVINDPGQGLLKLFEMVRIDKRALREAMAHELIQACLPQFSKRSPFLKTSSDIIDGVSAFRFCVDRLIIDPVAATANDAAFSEAIATIHEKLVPVLVENLPVTEFIKRFDKPYTVFYIPKFTGGIAGSLETIGMSVNHLQGCLLIEANNVDEIISTLQRFLKDIRLAKVGTVDFPTRLDKKTRLFIIKQGA